SLTLELRRMGYQAFTAQTSQGGSVSYRVRVGRFASREEAEAVERRLKQDPRFSSAYVTAQ
ncbi:MAG TPA: SPOR domain-containing protein, partial [Terriglobales bacterium]|nr:SPOR domain-containing protein [Terriglobales bacterium]